VLSLCVDFNMQSFCSSPQCSERLASMQASLLGSEYRGMSVIILMLLKGFQLLLAHLCLHILHTSSCADCDIISI